MIKGYTDKEDVMRVAIVPSTVGFHWEEVYDAYKQYKKEGWNIDFYTVDGKPAKEDPKSVEHQPLRSFIGLGIRDSFSPTSELGKEINYLLKNEVQNISDMNIDSIDVIYIPGGHGCLFDVNTNTILHQKLLEAFYKEKILSAVCHGTSTFAFVEDKGTSIVAGKKMTGFPDLLDDMLLKLGWVYEDFIPLPFSNEQKMRQAGAKLSGFNLFLSIVNPFHRVKDTPFVTGVGPKSAGRVAKKVIKMLTKQEEERVHQTEPAMAY